MPNWLAATLVFVTSAAVLVLEILAGRLLAPYVGVTLETFTAIIGVVLAAIAAGTWIGGILADRFTPARLLPPCLALGGAAAIASVPAVRALGGAATSAEPGTVVVLTTVGFFVPAAVLSAASPLVVKIQLDDLDRTGHVVGRLSAIGTAGALVGVFTTGFVLVASFPTTPIVVAVGAGLVVGGFALAAYFRAQPPTIPAARGALGVGAAAAALATAAAVTWTGPCQVETAYYCARVEIDPDRAGGRTLVLDTLRHSYVDLDDPTHLEFGYVATFGDVVEVVVERDALHAPEVLHIGGGGFTMPTYVDRVHAGSRNVVLEVDPALVDLARDELGFDPSDRTEVRTGDARTGLGPADAATFDVALGDAFGGIAVPWHLTTAEFVGEIATSLRPEGVYAVNVVDHPPLAFARAQLATLADVFEHVAVVAAPDQLRGERGGNLVLLASDTVLPVEALSDRLSARDAPGEVLGGAAARAFAGDARVLTDEFAPVDQLLTPRP